MDMLGIQSRVDGRWKVGHQLDFEGGMHNLCKARGRFYQKAIVKFGSTDDLSLGREFMIYNSLPRFSAHGFARVLFFGMHQDQRVLVLNRLGDSVATKVLNLNSGLPLTSTILIGIQALNRIQTLHSIGFVHGDIKPKSLVFGRHSYDQRRIYLIDFGSSRKYRDAFGNHFPEVSGRAAGSLRFSSVAWHEGRRLSRKDDLESLFYSLIAIHKRHLPWDDVDAAPQTKLPLIGKAKKDMSIQSLFDGMPADFAQAFHYVKNMSYDEAPDYDRIRNSLKGVLSTPGLAEDRLVDWETKISSESSNSSRQLELTSNDQLH